MSTLPRPSTLITTLISSIPQPREPTSQNPLRNASTATKQLLQTLHVLYPNEFLPALDVLDRHLITRLAIQEASPSNAPVARGENKETEQPSPAVHGNEASGPQTGRHEANPLNMSIYYVRSAQPQKSIYSHTGAGHGRSYDALATHYEVRPLAWNCSCPAFAFAAFPSLGSDLDAHNPSPDWPDDDDKNEWRFGGLSTSSGGGDVAPVCKHLLACVLVERCEVFRECLEEKFVSMEEIAGLCAGWGG
jgi:hypothetical protein